MTPRSFFVLGKWVDGGTIYQETRKTGRREGLLHMLSLRCLIRHPSWLSKAGEMTVARPRYGKAVMENTH